MYSILRINQEPTRVADHWWLFYYPIKFVCIVCFNNQQKRVFDLSLLLKYFLPIFCSNPYNS